MSPGDDSVLTPAQSARRERTLLVAIALSAFGPFATGFAVAMSRSTTQVADFVRRTVELGAMIVSWTVFRRLGRETDTGAERRTRLESVANLSVAAAMALAVIVLIARVPLRSRNAPSRQHVDSRGACAETERTVRLPTITKAVGFAALAMTTLFLFSLSFAETIGRIPLVAV